MKANLRALPLLIGTGLLAGMVSFAANAEITVLEQELQAGNPLSRLNFTVGGSIFPQFNMMSGGGAKGS